MGDLVCETQGDTRELFLEPSVDLLTHMFVERFIGELMEVQA